MANSLLVLMHLDGLHDHLHSSASMAGVQLRSGKWVSSLVYADDVVLLSWLASGLQLSLDSMNHFCLSLGLVIPCSSCNLISPAFWAPSFRKIVISPTKTEVVVFNGPGIANTWRVGARVG